jgi:hypothetical protein
MTNPLIRIEIPTNPEEAWIWTKRGHPAITAVVLWTAGPAQVVIDGVGRSGATLLDGGLRIPVETMDQIAMQWLRARGLMPPLPKEGSYAVVVDLGDFAAPDAETAAKEAFVTLENTSATNQSLWLLDSQGRIEAIDLAEFSIEELDEYTPIAEQDTPPIAFTPFDPNLAPHIRVEYDTHYTGGDYTDVGDYAYIPSALVEQMGVERAFYKTTDINSIHIVHWSADELFTAAGDSFEHAQADADAAELLRRGIDRNDLDHYRRCPKCGDPQVNRQAITPQCKKCGHILAQGEPDATVP